MKKRAILFLIACICLSVVWSNALAHGGVEKIVNGTIVSLNQTPLAPFVGEKVHLPFVFTEEKQYTPLTNIPVTVTVTDTFQGDELKDRIIYTSTASTDINGVLDFTYTFPRENYFDIDLHFKDAHGVEQETGFLVQARTAPQAVSKVWAQDIAFFFLGALCTVLIWRRV